VSEQTGELIVRGPYEVTDLHVYDADRNPVTTGVHELHVDLEPGLYRVQARVPGSTAERFVSIEPGKTTTSEDFQLKFDVPSVPWANLFAVDHHVDYLLLEGAPLPPQAFYPRGTIGKGRGKPLLFFGE
jgi:hypothetical protein